ncbi:disease resistance protein RGA2-like isoform X1 [Phragmites australis]|uniref:disease resistance protein RGA2-like isoform X1 n=1 Tax=Phragmites australis TaxID=29695 RepID=UPI002D7795A9|nr:disease resistance protein RGA2-like isoform X1 [Phragmites australis]XP_062187579.1 disease resistance protein RGA2-like isoform X1 [Phragmites australis]XP_062187580.1 disease resistance protein RGA2-like isoform X1 [Phragmites australis]
MEIFLPAVMGELTTRSINFFINKCFKPPAVAVEDRLQSALLRAQVIMDEAMGRRITNRSMLQQLDMLRDCMHRGYYTLDTFRYQSHDKEEVKDHIVSHSSLLSKVNSVKDLCFSTGTSTHILKEMQEVLDSLSSMILDSNELVLFLTSYPRMYREPYSMHLLLSKCMFGRQMETELVIKPHGAEELEVLPIVGPGRVGKSTLVAHVCNDERVRDHFSEIIFLSDHDFRDEKLTTLSEGCAKKYQNCTLNKDERMLVVVEAAGDFNGSAWKRLFSASRRCMTSGSKIIITSQSDKITTLGTTQAVTLKYLSHEAYWYFFKTLTFGSTDPAIHPRLAYLAMEIARMLKQSLIGATATASLPRDNFDIHFWFKVLTFLRGFIQRHVSKFGEHPIDALDQYRPAQLERMATPSEVFLVYLQCQRSSQEEVPKIRIQDVMYGSAKPHGKFEVLAWKSPIPPYHSYVYTCELRELKTTAAKRKRSMKNGVTLC